MGNYFILEWDVHKFQYILEWDVHKFQDDPL